MNEARDDIKRAIRIRFYNNVRGKIASGVGYNPAHDGAEGDWLTREMGLTVNGDNEPDLMGFEMKTDSSKTTFGDWSPDSGLFVKVPPAGLREMDREAFLKAFGVVRSKPATPPVVYYSWSGSVFPKVGGMNDCGQEMLVDGGNNITAEYDFNADRRPTKGSVVPTKYRGSRIELARWSAGMMKLRVENKFNQNGWFKCVKDSYKRYESIQFGLPLNFEVFIALVRSGRVFCDSGMHSTNPRPYMAWRAANSVWDSLAECESA